MARVDGATRRAVQTTQVTRENRLTRDDRRAPDRAGQGAARRGAPPPLAQPQRADSGGSTLRMGLLFFASDLMMTAIVTVGLLTLAAATPAAWPEGALWPFSNGIAPADPARAAIFGALLIAALGAAGLYKPAQWEYGEGRRALWAGLPLCLAYALLATQGSPAALTALGLAAGAAFGALILLGRMTVRSLGPAQSAMRRKIVLVSDGLTPEDLRRELRTSRAMRAEVVGAMTLQELFAVLEQPSSLQRRFYEVKYRARLDELTFAFAPSADEAPRLNRAVDALNAEGASAIIAVSLPGLVGRRLKTLRVFGGDILFAQVQAERPGGWELLAKRTVDVAGAGLGLLALSPILLIITLLLKTEGGSPFFAQKRVGKDRRRFDCFKFRTMVPDAEARLQAHLDADPQARREWDLHQKLKKDPRITRLGGFLRKTSLDELPQLWNVLRGDMSLVGPRPIIAPETPGYPQDAAYYHSDAFDAYARCRPGITGVWQVSGRSKTTHEERVRLDCWYARNWTIWLDLMVILKTVRAAVFGSAWA
ncbi:MAG: exopolysaccharide biosynthesis polyprenyl glycosylphosphotransferase [Pseudomonadota bacterium]